VQDLRIYLTSITAPQAKGSESTSNFIELKKNVGAF